MINETASQTAVLRDAAPVRHSTHRISWIGGCALLALLLFGQSWIAADEAFNPPPCTLPFDSIKVHQTIDDECRIDGSEADGSELVIKLQEKVLGIKHPDTLRTYFNLARCLKAEGKTDEARQFAQRAAEVAAKFLGENHPDTLKYQKLAQELQKN